MKEKFNKKQAVTEGYNGSKNVQKRELGTKEFTE